MLVGTPSELVITSEDRPQAGIYTNWSIGGLRIKHAYTNAIVHKLFRRQCIPYKHKNFNLSRSGGCQWDVEELEQGLSARKIVIEKEMQQVFCRSLGIMVLEEKVPPRRALGVIASAA